MFRQVKKSKAKEGKSFADKALIPIQPDTVLLSNDKRRKLILKIASFSQLPKQHFQDLYMQILHNFANFVQRLHIPENEKFDYLGGALDLGMERGQLAMFQYKTYLKAHSIYPKEFSIQHELWNYVLFSSALCYNLGAIILRQSVQLHDKNRKNIGPWNPFRGYMGENAAYFQPVENMMQHDAFEKNATALFARQIMPAQGFDWISSQVETMETWLAMLNSDSEAESGTRGLFLNLILWCDHAIFQAYETPTFGERLESILAFISPKEIESKDGKKGAEEDLQSEAEQLTEEALAKEALKSGDLAEGKHQKIFGTLGVEFLMWLRNGILNGDLSFNTLGATLQVVREGVLLQSPQIFKQFAEQAGSNVSWQQVQREFKQLGLPVTNLVGDYNQTYQVGPIAEHTKQGLVVANVDSIFTATTVEQNENYKLVGFGVEQTNWWQQIMVDKPQPTFQTGK